MNMDGSINISQSDLLDAVREAAVLADITISIFSAERSDRNILEKIKQDNGAVGNVGRVVKNMFAGADGELKTVRSAYIHVRHLHNAYTLPWISDPHAERQRGPRLLPNLLIDKYFTVLAKQRRVATELLDQFVDKLPDIIAQAKTNLGGLADAFYPTADEIKSSFRVHFDIEPIPSITGFKGLTDHMWERFSMAMQTKQARMVEQAQAHVWGEVRQRVNHMIERLEDKDTRFKKATIDNVRELGVLLPGWNLSNSGLMDEVAGDLEAALQGVTAEGLRGGNAMRQLLVTRSKKIITKLDNYSV